MQGHGPPQLVGEAELEAEGGRLAFAVCACPGEIQPAFPDTGRTGPEERLQPERPVR